MRDLYGKFFKNLESDSKLKELYENGTFLDLSGSTEEDNIKKYSLGNLVMCLLRLLSMLQNEEGD